METVKELDDFLCERGYEGTAYFENPDYISAIEGISEDGRVVYNFEKMVQHLMDEDGMEYEEAVEFIDYNTIRTIPYMGSSSPVVLYPIDF